MTFYGQEWAWRRGGGGEEGGREGGGDLLDDQLVQPLAHGRRLQLLGGLVLVALAQQRDDLDHAHHSDEAQDAADARARLERLRHTGEIVRLRLEARGLGELLGGVLEGGHHVPRHRGRGDQVEDEEEARTAARAEELDREVERLAEAAEEHLQPYAVEAATRCIQAVTLRSGGAPRPY
jgi:hypothetical protein